MNSPLTYPNVRYLRRAELGIAALVLVGKLSSVYREAQLRHGELLGYFEKRPTELAGFQQRYHVIFTDFLPATLPWLGLFGAWVLLHFWAAPRLLHRRWLSGGIGVGAGLGWAILFVSLYRQFWLVPRGTWEGGEIAYAFPLEPTDSRLLNDLRIVLFLLLIYEAFAQGVYGWLDHLRDRPHAVRHKTAVRHEVIERLVIAAGIWGGGLLLIAGFRFYLPTPVGAVLVVSLPTFFACYLTLRYWLLPRYDQRKNAAWLLAYVIGLTPVLTFLGTLVFVKGGLGVTLQTGVDIWLTHWILAVAGGLPLAWRNYENEKKRMVLEKSVQTNQTELASLKAQINPHFLFNALNTLYAAALQEGGERTATGIQKLGDLMRFMLHDNARDTIDLSRELQYLRDYVELQRLRIGEVANVEIRLELPEESCPQQLAPMLLVPFVENAFKHGISLRNPSWIDVRVTCGPDRVCLIVQNSLHPKPTEDPEREASGIGLENVKKRLELLYPRRHTLSIHETGREFSVELEIQGG